ncbi:MAG: hypothetical protein ACP5E3_15710 [Bacteroidales bacterium]
MKKLLTGSQQIIKSKAMEEKVKDYVTLQEEELYRVSGGIQIPGNRLIIWIIGKIAPGGII